MSIVAPPTNNPVFKNRVVSSARLAWSHEFEVGQPVVDEQHRALFDRINEIFDAVQHGSLSWIIELLDILITEAMQHFRDEEAILARSGHPSVRDHRRIHRDLMAKMLMHRHDVAQAALPLATLLDFLADELVFDHIFGEDRATFRTLKNQ